MTAIYIDGGNSRPGIEDQWQTTRQTHLGARQHVVGQAQEEVDRHVEAVEKLIYETGYAIDENDSEQRMIFNAMGTKAQPFETHRARARSM